MKMYEFKNFGTVVVAQLTEVGGSNPDIGKIDIEHCLLSIGKTKIKKRGREWPI